MSCGSTAESPDCPDHAKCTGMLSATGAIKCMLIGDWMGKLRPMTVNVWEAEHILHGLDAQSNV